MSPDHGRRPYYGMAPCRPASEHSECAQCMRMQLPTEHVFRGGTRIQRVTLDVRAILPVDEACPLRVAA